MQYRIFQALWPFQQTLNGISSNHLPKDACAAPGVKMLSTKFFSPDYRQVEYEPSAGSSPVHWDRIIGQQEICYSLKAWISSKTRRLRQAGTSCPYFETRESTRQRHSRSLCNGQWWGANDTPRSVVGRKYSNQRFGLRTAKDL